jgi:hypothetical protein
MIQSPFDLASCFVPFQISARFLIVNPWSMGTFQSPHPLGIISRGYSLPTSEEVRDPGNKESSSLLYSKPLFTF